jgi:hypothetical protein
VKYVQKVDQKVDLHDPQTIDATSAGVHELHHTFEPRFTFQQENRGHIGKKLKNSTRLKELGVRKSQILVHLLYTYFTYAANS